MKIILSGGSGLVGSALTRAFRLEGHEVAHLVRPGRALSRDEIRWDPLSARADIAGLEGAGAVVHLSGANVSEGRWTEARKQVLRSSRVDTARVLVDALAQLRHPPQVFICASAVGYYGNRGDELLTESSQPGENFLALLARDWEAEANRAQQAGIRTVMLRFGVILAGHRGALPQMVLPFRLGLGGRLGGGAQWLSWIALEDVVGVVRFVLDNPTVRGPVNTVAPSPVRNAEFTRILGRVLRRPAVIPVPTFVMRLALGEMADALLLGSQRAIPEKLRQANYGFKFPDLETTLRFILRPSQDSQN